MSESEPCPKCGANSFVAGLFPKLEDGTIGEPCPACEAKLNSVPAQLRRSLAEKIEAEWRAKTGAPDFMLPEWYCLKCGKGHKKGKCADVIIDVGDGRFGVVSDEPATAGPQAFGWRSADSFYPSGFAVGDTVHLIAGKRKYNAHIDIPVGSILTVIEPPNREGWPDDAVQIMFKSGIGAVDASLLRHFRP